MSRPPTNPKIAASADLQRVADEGYALELRGGHLVLHDVPYVTTTGTVQHGKLVMPITFAGDVAATPSDHVAMWVGEHPCHQDGRVMTEISHNATSREVETGLVVDHSFSAKPKPADRYPDFYEKLMTYVNRIAGPAAAIDKQFTAQAYGVLEVREDTSVFRYTENASALAGIAALTPKLAVGTVAIVGLGGTGGYVLDFLAKTPAHEIHLYDGDELLQHNAFRAPGTDYFHAKYDPMRRGIIPHAVYIDESNVAELLEMHTVFVCADSGPTRKLIVDTLKGSRVCCIIVGMGIQQTPLGLAGQIATTTASPGRWDHVEHRVSFGTRDDDADAYGQNIQVAELNALNAVMAIIKWKKLCGFYVDLEHEGHSAYIIEGNGLVSDDQPDPQ